MRAWGINWLAVLAAAIAFYVIGFLIYGFIIPEETFMAMSGMSPDQIEAAQPRMAFGVLMPLATAMFLAVLFKWANVAGAGNGAKWAAVVALASAVPTVWYGWVYGGMSADMSLVDSAHLLIGHAAAGAILGGWK